jgi:hypothetical protein
MSRVWTLDSRDRGPNSGQFLNDRKEQNDFQTRSLADDSRSSFIDSTISQTGK